MEEFSILTISMFFNVIYLYSIMCLYFDMLLYDVFNLLHLNKIPSTLIDASMYVSITDSMVEVSYSFNVMHTQVCVTFDKFTIVISLFFGILKFIIFLSIYMLWEKTMPRNVHLGWTSHLLHRYHVLS